MARLLVLLDRQHAGKRAGDVNDRGAWGDLDHDGKQETEELEAIWTARYLLAAELRLLALGHRVIPLSDGWYRERHARANLYSAGQSAVYVAAHLNSLHGGLTAASGTYGTVFFDHRSDVGPVLAEAVREKLAAACTELAQVKALACRPSDWTSRAYGTISGVDAPALCFEPAFIDQTAHRPLFSDEGMRRIGVALAEGIHAWAS